MISVRQDIMVRQRHLRNRNLTAQSTSNVVICNLDRPKHRDTVIYRLRERGIRCPCPANCQVLIDILYSCVSFSCQFTSFLNTEIHELSKNDPC